MSITIPPAWEQFVQQEVDNGNFGSRDEVVSEALRLLNEKKQFELRKAIDEGLKDLERGDVITFDDEAAIREYFEQLKAGVRQPS